MRTTVDIDDELRAKLKQLAAERGEKGYSSLINEALREYLRKNDVREDKVRHALKLEGSINDEEVDELEDRIEAAWNSWEL